MEHFEILVSKHRFIYAIHHLVYSIEIGWLNLFNSFVKHGSYTATCSVTTEKTGNQVDLDIFMVISALCLPFYDKKFLGTFLGFRLLEF